MKPYSKISWRATTLCRSMERNTLKKALLILGLSFALASTAHASCLVLGDSIATHAGLGGQLPQCANVARQGAPTSWIARNVPSTHYDIVYISAGSNDWGLIQGLDARLQNLRNKVAAYEVVWILPALPGPRADVAIVSAENHDRAVSFVAGDDHVHPKSYQALARSVLTRVAGK